MLLIRKQNLKVWHRSSKWNALAVALAMTHDKVRLPADFECNVDEFWCERSRKVDIADVSRDVKWFNTGAIRVHINNRCQQTN